MGPEHSPTPAIPDSFDAQDLGLSPLSLMELAQQARLCDLTGSESYAPTSRLEGLAANGACRVLRRLIIEQLRDVQGADFDIPILTFQSPRFGEARDGSKFISFLLTVRDRNDASIVFDDERAYTNTAGPVGAMIWAQLSSDLRTLREPGSLPIYSLSAFRGELECLVDVSRRTYENAWRHSILLSMIVEDVTQIVATEESARPIDHFQFVRVVDTEDTVGLRIAQGHRERFFLPQYFPERGIVGYRIAA